MARGPHLILLALICAFQAAPQAHTYSPGDIEEGMRRYRISCIGCHGGDGTAVTGIDLGRGKFRRVSSDEELVQVILYGIPGTGMPATFIPTPRAYAIVAFIRTMNDTGRAQSIAAPSGSVSRGKALFAGKGGCMNCHRIRGEGGRSAPDLTEAGLTLRAIEIETSLLDPDADYGLSSRPFRVVEKSGTEVTGLLLNQDSYTVQLQDSQGNLRSFPRSSLRDAGSARSRMPSYRGKLDAQELADLIAYVGSQRGGQ
jgi:putative heme-binding domain-containing protein